MSAIDLYARRTEGYEARLAQAVEVLKAAAAQHAAGHKLKHKFFAFDNDRMPGVVAAGISRDERKVVGKDVDNLALALIAPLRPHDYRRFAWLHFVTHSSPVTVLQIL